jgi:hypothetical protein
MSPRFRQTAPPPFDAEPSPPEVVRKRFGPEPSRREVPVIPFADERPRGGGRS